MADFYQTGIVTTLHRLRPTNLEMLEGHLEKLSSSVSIGLVLPALYSEFETPAMQGIVDQLRTVKYLRHVVLALARANEEQYHAARAFFKDFHTPPTIIWVDKPAVRNLFEVLEKNGLGAGPDGKGRSCWLAYGYLLSTGDCDVIALHDCDIVNYDRQLLARLVYPVANPNLGFEFCKGYYARVTSRMHGRVTRLFVTPLIRAMRSMVPGATFLDFLDSFRYALAGEFAMRSNLARVNRIPPDWGLEVGVLAEVFRNCAVARVCQTDLAENYEHKHQELSAEDASKGLRRMAQDIAKSLFFTLSSEGFTFTLDHFRSLQVRYIRMAEDTISRYYADATINGLEFDRHSEEVAVAAFAQSLSQAADEYVKSPLGRPLIPNWNRVISAVPSFFTQLQAAINV